MFLQPEFVQFCPPVGDMYEGEGEGLEWLAPSGWMDLTEGEHPLLLDDELRLVEAARFQ